MATQRPRKPDPDTTRPVAVTRSRQDEPLFHVLRPDEHTKCGKGPDDIWAIIPNDDVPDLDLPPDARPCCRCFGLTREQSHAWMQPRMQTYMKELMEARGPLNQGDPAEELRNLFGSQSR